MFDFNNYLTFILTRLPNEEEGVRAMAGLLLKNNVRVSYHKFHQDVREYIKQACLEAVGDPWLLVRSTVGILITTIVTQAKLQSWPQLLPHLLKLLDMPDYNVREGALGAMQKLCEDSASDIASEEFAPILDVMVPKFLSLFTVEQEKLRVHSIAAINQFVPLNPPALMANMNVYLQCLYNRATDPSPEVRRHVCQALVMLLDIAPAQLMPQINSIIEYMLHSTQDEDENVALEACEFWFGFAEHPSAREILQPYLPRLIPVLLNGMVYSEMELLAFDEEDSSVPDRDQDIKPRFHKAKTHALDHVSGNSGDVAQGGTAQSEEHENGDEGEDDDDECDDEEDPFADWNIRKCSAAALDTLASLFGVEMLASLLPVLQLHLTHAEWVRREAGILGLGAVAEGCMEGLIPHLPELFTYLLHSMNDPKPLLRSITCWTLSRYCSWCVLNQDGTAFFERLLGELLNRVLDNNKRVQQAACSALATFEEEANDKLVKYLKPILEAMSRAFQKYQQKNLLILYDAISTLADAVGSELNNEKYINLLMPPLIKRWNALTDEDRGLFPLLEVWPLSSSGAYWRQHADIAFLSV